MEPAPALTSYFYNQAVPPFPSNPSPEGFPAPSAPEGERRDSEELPPGQIALSNMSTELQLSPVVLQEHIITPIQVPTTHQSIADWIDDYRLQKLSVTWPNDDSAAKKSERRNRNILIVTGVALLIGIIVGGIFSDKPEGAITAAVCGPMLAFLAVFKVVTLIGNRSNLIKVNRETLLTAWSTPHYLTFLDNKLKSDFYGPVKQSKDESLEQFAKRARDMHKNQPPMSEEQIKTAAEAVLIDSFICRYWITMETDENQSQIHRNIYEKEIDQKIREKCGLYMRSDALRRKRESVS